MDTNERCFWPIVIIGMTKHWQLPQLHELLQVVSGTSVWEHRREHWFFFFYSERPGFEFCFFLDSRLWANCLISRSIIFLIWKLGMKALELQPCYQVCVCACSRVGVQDGMLLYWHVEGAQWVVVLMILAIINNNSYEGCEIQIFEWPLTFHKINRQLIKNKCKQNK